MTSGSNSFYADSSTTPKKYLAPFIRGSYYPVAFMFSIRETKHLALALLMVSSVVNWQRGTINLVQVSTYGKNFSFNSSIKTDNIWIAISASSLS